MPLRIYYRYIRKAARCIFGISIRFNLRPCHHFIFCVVSVYRVVYLLVFIIRYLSRKGLPENIWNIFSIWVRLYVRLSVLTAPLSVHLDWGVMFKSRYFSFWKNTSNESHDLQGANFWPMKWNEKWVMPDAQKLCYMIYIYRYIYLTKLESCVFHFSVCL